MAGISPSGRKTRGSSNDSSNRPQSRLGTQPVDPDDDHSHAVIYRYPRVSALDSVRPRENVLNFFYPTPSVLKSVTAENINLRRQRRDIFLLAFQAVQRLPRTDKWSYYQIAAIHGLPYEPYDEDTGSWVVREEGTRWGGYCQHGTPLFPTWHRPYVMLLEQSIIRQALLLAGTLFQDKEEKTAVSNIAPTLRFPYWDWADPSTTLLGVPDIFTSTDISLLYKWKSFSTRKIANPLKSFVSPLDVGTPYASSDVYTPQTKPRYVVPPEGSPFLPAGYPTVRHVSSAYVSQTDQLNLTVMRNAASILIEGVYWMFRLTEWLPFSNHYWAESTHGKGHGYEYGHYPSLELVHDSLHDTVGGSGGQMAYPDCAGFDPIFFFHHANVDRLAALWQYCNPDAWIVDDKQEICDGTYTIEPNTPAKATTDLTPFRRSQKNYEFVSSNDVRVVDEDCGYSYPELITARKQKWSPNVMLWHMLSKYQPCQHYKDNWTLVLERIKKRIFNMPYSIRVFLDKPDATAHTSLSDPHFAGHVSIFARSTGAMCANCDQRPFMRASLSVTKTMDRLGITIAPTTAEDNPLIRKDAITLVYVSARGDQLHPEEVLWEGPSLFVYHEEGVDGEEDFEAFRRAGPSAAFISGSVHKFPLI